MKKLILPAIIAASFFTPVVAFYLNLQLHPPLGASFALFVLLHALMRVWETFFTSKEKNKMVLSEDWSLVFITVVYITLIYAVIFEFYLSSKQLNLIFVIVGSSLYLASFALRRWSMRVLGKQWAIHAIGDSRIDQRRLLKIGPYKIVRHPIYVATVIEQLGILLIANTFYSLVIFFLMTLPSYYLRMKVEEKNNKRIFGESYQRYKKEVNMFIPTIKSG
mgnify:CR=1 FL=1